MPKYVFSSTLTSAEWDNSVIVSGDVTTEVTRLKEQAGDLLIWAIPAWPRRCCGTGWSI